MGCFNYIGLTDKLYSKKEYLRQLELLLAKIFIDNCKQLFNCFFSATAVHA